MALRNQPYIPLYVQDYVTDEKLQLCSYSTQGIYVRIMCALHKSEHYGRIMFKQAFKQNLSMMDYFVHNLQRQTGVPDLEIREAIQELLHHKVLKIDENSIYQSRMVKDGEISAKRSESAKIGGGNPKLSESKKNDKHLFKQKDKQNTEYEYENEYENKAEDEKTKRRKSKKINSTDQDLELSNEVVPKSEIEIKQDLLWEKWKRYKWEQFKFRYKSNESELIGKRQLIEMSNGDPIIMEDLINRAIGNGWKGIHQFNESINKTISTDKTDRNKESTMGALKILNEKMGIANEG